MSFLITLSATSGTNYLFFYYLSGSRFDHRQSNEAPGFGLCADRHCVHAWSLRNVSEHQPFANSMCLLFFIAANENVASRHASRIFSLGFTGVLPSIIFSPKL